MYICLYMLLYLHTCEGIFAKKRVCNGCFKGTIFVKNIHFLANTNKPSKHLIHEKVDKATVMLWLPNFSTKNFTKEL